MTILDYLYNSCEKTPDKTAFIDDKRSLSYAQTLNLSKRIATFLANESIGINAPIAVFIDRNVESLCAFFAIAMVRCFYIPIDVTQPLHRISTIIDQMQPKAIVSLGNIPEEVQKTTNVPVFEYDKMIQTEIDEDKLSELRQSALDTDPLYAICTSGSTGVPKGVLISHRSVLDFIPVFTKTFNFDSNDIFGNQAPFDFDVSVKDIYSSLYLGATVYIIPKVCFSMPKKLVEALDSNKITTIIWAVSALCIVAGLNAFKHKVPSSIKNVLFSGEVMPIKMLNIWRKYIPDALYVNLYGPTEITCNCLYYIIDKEFSNTDKLPLGKPFYNEGVLFLSDDDKEIDVGETGEICVKGTCLALGYYRNPEKTAAAFVQNPLNTSYPETIYRTGDLAQLKEDGQYYFAARKDFQIKHMGHRIELEEIETFMSATNGVLRASCLFDTEKNKIVAFYTGEISKTDIINNLKKDLPKYMVPNIFIQLPELPLNKNGKIDRQKLKDIYFEKG